MTYNFCSLFDSGFLNRWLALYASIARHCKEPFHFYVLTMDDAAHDTLTKLALPHITLIRLAEIENDALREAKENRGRAEYCWTVGPSLLSFVLEKYPELEAVTYLDADLYFYASPTPIFKAFEGHSTLITPHHLFYRKEKREKSFGKYNVGLLIFRNDEDGRACLHWWRDKCIEWCYDKVEPTRFGDQKYLDYFEEQFKGVFVLDWPGVGLARWNIDGYTKRLRKAGGKLLIGDEPVYFFHFSAWKLYYPPSSWLPWGPPSLYTFPSKEKYLLYREYAAELYKAMDQVRTVWPDFAGGTLPRPAWYQQLNALPVPYAKAVLKKLLGQ